MPAVPQPNERHRQLALHHANLIQQRKDIEASVFAGLEELLDFPAHPAATASSPHPDDIAQFLRLVQPFQASDFDALIEERNAAGHCGYVFCPNPPKRDPFKGNTRIVWGGRTGGLEIVPREHFEVWCSRECRRRAMYIKVQLREEPAWERAGGLGNRIEVLTRAGDELLQRKMQALSLEKVEEEEMKQAMAELALERGEKRDAPIMAGVMTTSVQEKEPTGVAAPPALRAVNVDGQATAGHFEIEGYTPNRARWKK